MPAHIKSALVGASVTIPIRDGKLATGTWQGICTTCPFSFFLLLYCLVFPGANADPRFLGYLEFRAAKHQRRVVATIQGEKA